MLLNESEIFWRNLEKIKNTLLLDDSGFAGTLGLSLKEYIKLRDSSTFLPLDCMFEFAEKMNFHLEDLMSKDFKMKTEVKKSNGEFVLGERYSYATYSEIQPLRNIINYLELVRGERAKINLIRKFQLTEEFFAQTEQKTNINLITDIVAYMDKTYRFSDSEFIGMGQRTPFVTKSTYLSDKLSHHKTVQDVVSSFFEECTHLFDQNYHYRISSMESDQAIIEAIPRNYVLDEMKIKRQDFGNEKLCLTRMGVISSMTYFKYGTNAPITKIASLQNGDMSNRYLVDLSIFKNLSRLPSRLERRETVYQ